MKEDSPAFNSTYNKAGSSSVGRVDRVDSFTDEQGSIPAHGKPNSVTQKKDEDGNVITERYYNGKGEAYLDIDYTNHGNPKNHPVVPHQHNWERDEKGNLHRGKARKIKHD